LPRLDVRVSAALPSRASRVQGSVFGLVVDLVWVEAVRRRVALPLGRSRHSDIAAAALIETELRADMTCVRNPVLGGIAGGPEVRWDLIVGSDDELAFPVHCSSDSLRPLEFRQRVGLANVEDLA
jgi:hypothetical protein